MILDRRAFVGGMVGTSLAAPFILPAQGPVTADPFTLGVASGDPAPDGFVIWTRLAPEPLAPMGGMPSAPVPVEWEVAADSAFGRIAAKGRTIARPALAHSVHVEVSGLQPGRPYWYRFTAGRARSAAGQARTLPARSARLDRVRFAVAGCQNYEHGWYTGFAHIAAEPDVDFLFHYGDYIYEERGHDRIITWDKRELPFVRRADGGECLSLDDYRRRYAQEKVDPDLQAAHRAYPWWVTFDDHDVQDNWAGDRDKAGDAPAIFRRRRAAAFQAWYEHMPVRASSLPRGPDVRMHRRAHYGDLLDLHLLDTRQYRSDQPCGDGYVPVCPGIDDPKAEMVGRAQEAWLAQGLRGDARWNAIGQQVMMMPIDRRWGSQTGTLRNMDSWGGYNAPRERIARMLEGLGNVVVLTGDEHITWVGELRRDDGRGKTVAVEIVGTSITSEGDGRDTSPMLADILAGNDCLKFANSQRGYLLCDVTRDRWDAKLRVMEQVSVRGSGIATRATVTVPHGHAEVHVA
jgi:alkaline phosphatase D